jgi:putative ABC transport system permease protein
MRTSDVLSSAAGNAFRSKTRTALTVIAIFIGAFTLTITNGLGTGINMYISDTLASIGAKDVMTVTNAPAKVVDANAPVAYDPTQVRTSAAGPPGTTSTFAALTAQRLDELRQIPGVLRVEANKNPSVNFVQGSNAAPYRVAIGNLISGMRLTLTAGTQPNNDTAAYEVAIPTSFVTSLGFASDAAAIGQQVTFGLNDANRVAHTLTATVVGVADAGLIGTVPSATPNSALRDALYSTQNTGLATTANPTYTSATVWFDAAKMSDAQVKDLQATLKSAGFASSTVADQIGTFKTIIDAIVLVLNAFAIIALIAAGFGIINTLFMSVQERTREIGLMKAMGMSSNRIFQLFSLEAVIIGLLGSGIGVGIGMLVGTVLSRVLSKTLFSSLVGLKLIAFDAASIAGVVLLVVAIAFLAGTLPAIRAARKDPIESLRYE